MFRHQARTFLFLRPALQSRLPPHLNLHELLRPPQIDQPKSLSGLLPFLRPYRARIGMALVFLVLAAGATLAFPVALRSLIDGGLVQTDKGAQMMALRGHFVALFGVAVALGLFRRRASTW